MFRPRLANLAPNYIEASRVARPLIAVGLAGAAASFAVSPRDSARGLAAVALIVAVALLPMTAYLRLRLRLPLLARILTIRRQVKIRLRDVVSAEPVAQHRQRLGIPTWGWWLPGLVCAGWFIRANQARETFIVMRMRRPVVVIGVRNSTIEEAVVQVEDPSATAALIRRAAALTDVPS